MSAGEFFIGWLVLVVIVVCAIYYGPRLRSRSRSQAKPVSVSAPRATAAVAVPAGAAYEAQGEEPSVPRPSEPHATETDQPAPVAAHTTDLSTVKQPGKLPKWFSRKLKPTAPVKAAAVEEEFTIDADVEASTVYGRQGEARDVRTDVEAVETSRGAQLRTLDGLRAQGFLTDDEYESRRTAILGA